MMHLAARLELERRNRDPREIVDLNLDNSRASEIEGLTDEYINLENLSLIHVGLQSLNGFPKLTSLKKLDLSENNISGTLDVLVDACPHLEQLNLTNNVFKSLEALRPLTHLKHLRNLDVFNCPVASDEAFREEIFRMLPHLKYLDGLDINCQEETDSEDSEYIGEEESGDEEDDGEEVVEVGDDDDEEDAVQGRDEEVTEDVEYGDEDDEDDEDVGPGGDQEDDEEEVDDEEEEEESVTNQSEDVTTHSNNHQSYLRAAAPHAGKWGMHNHHPVPQDDIDEQEEDVEDEVVGEGEDDPELVDGMRVVDEVETEEVYLLGDDDDISQGSGVAVSRGVKRKYPLTSEDEFTNDSALTND